MNEFAFKPVVAVIGAGPAGLRAAEAIARHGLKPFLIDEASKPGGQIYRQPPADAERPGQEIYGFEATKAKRLHAIVSNLAGQLDYRPETLVWNITTEGGQFRLDLLQDQAVKTIHVDRVILATGAVDRALPFPGWLTPGVFTLGAAQIALKAQGVAIGRRVVLVGAGPLLPLLVAQYLAAGIKPVAALDVTPFAGKITALGGLLAQPATLVKGLLYLLKGALGGITIQSGICSIRALGQDRVNGFAYTTSNGHTHEIACDAIAASFGLRSEAQLADLVDCSFTFDPLCRQWQPVCDRAGRATVNGIYLAGDGAAIAGADVAELAGERAALTLLADAGITVSRARTSQINRKLARHAHFRKALEIAYPFPGHLLERISSDTVVCRCEGITAGDIRQIIEKRAPTEINRLKAFSRLGMGRCQGRMCGHVGAELLAIERGVEISTAGRLRAQPPVKPLPMAVMLGAKDTT